MSGFNFNYILLIKNKISPSRDFRPFPLHFFTENEAYHHLPLTRSLCCDDVEHLKGEYQPIPGRSFHFISMCREISMKGKKQSQQFTQRKKKKKTRPQTVKKIQVSSGGIKFSRALVMMLELYLLTL